MTKARHPGTCSLYSPTTNCNCGSAYERASHPVYPLTFPICPSCGESPSYYILLKRISPFKVLEFRYDKRGRRLKTLEACNRVSHEIHYDIEDGTFKESQYKRRSGTSAITDTISDFIEENIFPRQRELRISLDEKQWLQDYFAPFFADVGVFVVSKVHLRDFINTFRLKGAERARAERLFNLVVEQIKL